MAENNTNHKNYMFPTINNIDEITQCERYFVRQKLWATDYPFEVYGRMALIPGKEWVITMTTGESNPLRTYIHENDMVYRDSAMEVFLNFQPEDGRDRYLNFEMNANGAMLSQFGDRYERRFISDLCKQYVATCTAMIEPEQWSVTLRIPLELINQLYGREVVKEEERFTFNLYKICESKEKEHYVSFTNIPVEKPNFHLPQYFANGYTCKVNI